MNETSEESMYLRKNRKVNPALLANAVPFDPVAALMIAAVLWLGVEVFRSKPTSARAEDGGGHVAAATPGHAALVHEINIVKQQPGTPEGRRAFRSLVKALVTGSQRPGNPRLESLLLTLGYGETAQRERAADELIRLLSQPTQAPSAISR